MNERTHPPGGTPEGPRPPERNGLTRLRAGPNRLGAREVAAGGCATFEAGFSR